MEEAQEKIQQWERQHIKEWNSLLDHLHRLHYSGFQAGTIRKEIVLIAGEPGCWTRRQVDSHVFASQCNCSDCVTADEHLVKLKESLSFNSENYGAILCEEVEPEECLYCLYGEIPSDAKPPFSLCLKHLDITMFVLEKVGIPCWVEDAESSK